MSAQPSPIQILLAEDNRADVRLVEEALHMHSISYNLHVVSDGASAIRFLDLTDDVVDSPCPDLLLLDLNLPKRTGADILARLRRSEKCGKIPAVVLTSSDSPKDRDEVTRLGVTHFFRKPIELDKFLELGALVKRILRPDPD